MATHEFRRTVVETEHALRDKEELRTALFAHRTEWQPTASEEHPVELKLVSFENGKLTIRTSQK